MVVLECGWDQNGCPGWEFNNELEVPKNKMTTLLGVEGAK
jgi:hypothetical protein